MEPFTLILWIWMGQRFEQTEIQGLTREQCFTQLLVIGGDRKLVKPQCTAPGYREPVREMQCADCGPLPGRRQVLVPHICGVAPPCTPSLDGPGNAMLFPREQP